MKKIFLLTISIFCLSIINGQMTTGSDRPYTVKVFEYKRTDTVFGWLRIVTVDGFKYGKGRVIEDVYEKYDMVPCGGNYAAICYGIITETRIKTIVFADNSKIIDKNKWYEFIPNDKLQQ